MTRFAHAMVDLASPAETPSAQSVMSLFIAAIRDEYQALIDADAERLLASTDRKAKAGARLSALLQSNETDLTTLTAIRDQLQEASMLNKVNEKLLTQRLSSTRAQLAILAHVGGRYNAQGEMQVGAPIGSPSGGRLSLSA